MNFKNGTIIHIAHYSAPYEGNFIKSLKFLEAELLKYNNKTIYIFPNEAKKQLWFDEFSNEHTTYLTENDVQNSSNKLFEIFEKYKPTIVHTHFEGYDIPAKKAINKLKRKTNQPTNLVWHLHDYFSYVNNPIKKLYQKFCFYNHYGYYAKDVSIIGVCDEIKDFVKIFNWGRFNIETTIPNGIDFSRIQSTKNWANTEQIETFLAFGGRNIQKRIDLILNAFSKIYRDKFYIHTYPKLILVKGSGTTECINSFFNGETPSWLKLIEPTENITEVFSMADCFISSSVHETFSYAICEATIYGIPVIQSDIPGTRWNAYNPSTFLFRNMDSDDLTYQIKKVQQTTITQIVSDCEITRENNMRDYSIKNWVNQVISFYNQL